MTRCWLWRGCALFAALSAVTACGIGDAQMHLRSAVDAKQQELNACYAGALTRNAAAAGTMHADLHVETTTGRLERVQYQSDPIQDEAFQACMTGVLQSVQLPEAPAVNLEVAYTFHFTPSN